MALTTKKRKLSFAINNKNSCIEDEEDKTIKKQKKNGLEEQLEDSCGKQEENEIEPDQHCYEEYENEFKNIKYSTDFKMLKFREKLRGNNFIPELRHFLYLAEIKPQIINKYLQKHGKPLELAVAIERVDKSHLYHTSYICHAFQKVLMEILTNEKTHTVNAVNASRFFLRNHSQVIEGLLKSPVIEHRKIILKVLTAIVCLEPQLGRQILSSFDILSNVQLTSTLLSHSDKDSKETETVRKCFIHFLLSYLIDGNVLLIRNIMDKTNLLKTLICGLNYDDHVTVSIILNTLLKYIIKNPEITKTKKIHLFDLASVKQIIALYDWKGPKQSNENRKIILEENSSQYLEKKESVRKTAHEFLILLLSSRKYGITFDSITNFKQKYNILQGKIIKSLNKPWLDELKIELVTKILIACPELGRTTIKNYANCLNPFKTAQKFWVQIAVFIEKIIIALHPSVLKLTTNNISLTEITNWIKNVCLSPDILIHLNGKNSLKSENDITRISTTRLLLQMYSQHCNYMKTISMRDENKGNDLRKFKFDILNHIYINFPSVENILLSLYQTIQEKNNVNVIEHLSITLDIILLMAENNRSFINKTGMIIDYIKMLQPLYTGENVTNIDLELKAVKTILLLMPNALNPKQNLFSNILTSFLKIFTTSSGITKSEVGELLKIIFFNTGFFENDSLEIDLWLEATQYVDNETIEILNLVFLKCFQSNVMDIRIESKTEKNEIEIETNNYATDLFKNIENERITEGYIRSPIMSKLFLFIIDNVKIGKKLANYLEIISILLFHYIPDSDILRESYITVNELKIHKEYMENWCLSKKCEKGINMDMIYNFEKINESILNGRKNFIELFKNKKNCSIFNLNGMEISLCNNLKNEKLILIYINLICFLVSKSVKYSKFVIDIAKSAAEYMGFLLQILHQTKNIDNKQENGLFLELVLKYIFCSQTELINQIDLFGITESNQNYIYFLSEIIQAISKFNLNCFNELTKFSRSKLIKQIQNSVQDTKCGKNIPKTINGIKYLENIQLTKEDCVLILESISQLEASYYSSSVYFDILIHCLNRLAELKISIVDKVIVMNIANLYIDLSIDENINMDKLNESLYNFLQISHQLIKSIPIKFFEITFEMTKIQKSTIKLMSLLFERTSVFDVIFLEKLMKHSGKKELIYPLLNIAYSKNLTINHDVTQHIYQEYKSGFIKFIEKPQKIGVTYKDNVEAVIQLINEHMPLSECIDFTKKNLRPDSVEIFQLKVINAIYKKAIVYVNIEEEQYKSIFVNYIFNLIHFYDKCMSRRDYVESTIKLDLLNYHAFEWFEKFHHNYECDFQQLLNLQLWSNICKNFLKIGMQKYEITEIDFDYNAAKFLKFFAYLCSKLYNNTENHPDIIKIFEMILGHSKYFDIIHVKKPTYIKTEIFHLLLVLGKLNPNFFEEKHIPIYLSAYQAKMYQCDQNILALLKLYEKNGINLYSYGPFLWGDAAVDYYSVTSNDVINLQQQEPSTLQVMSLIEKQTCEYTIQNYPIWRKLHVLDELPEIVFRNPLKLNINKFGENNVEKIIFNEENEFNKINLKISPINVELISECYDPAFIIPLSILCFSPEMYSHPVRPVQNGLLGICFAALSSEDKAMRLAAGCFQNRYRQHFENGKFFEVQLWSQVYTNIQNGLGELQSNMGNQNKFPVPKISYISGLFLAKSMHIFIDPSNILYKPLIMYLRLKESFDFQCVPAFNVMFHNPETDHVQFREFILEIINDGIKSNTDVMLMITTNSFKAIMGFYGSSMSSLEINLLILLIINSSVKIPSTIKHMVDQVGTLIWLNSVIEEIEYFHFDTIEIIIKILSNLSHSIQLKKTSFHNFNHIQLSIFNLCIKLSPYLSGRISVEAFIRYLIMLEKGCETNSYSLKEENLDRILNSANQHFPEHYWKIINLKNYGTEGMASKINFCKNLEESGAKIGEIIAMNSMRVILANKFKLNK